MYTKYFDLTEEPFSIAANPRFLYMSTRHREALALLLYGIRSDSGFVMLTGEVGTGKTTVCRSLMEQLPERSNVAFILNPKVTVDELLSSICDEFGIIYEHTKPTVKTYVDAISHYLLKQHAQGRNTVVIIDEAQNLSFDVLEQLRLLTNLETNERKLLRIILLGQPELESMLSRPEFKQVEQRITARFTLTHLARNEIQAYVSHRLAVAGCQNTVFPPQVIKKLYAISGGIPRLINILCDRAMLGAYVKSRQKVSIGILNQAAHEVQGQSKQGKFSGGFVLSAVIVTGVILTALFYTNQSQQTELSLVQPSQISLAGKSDYADKVENKPTSPSGPPTQNILDSSSEQPVWPEKISANANTERQAESRLFTQWKNGRHTTAVSSCDQAYRWGLRCYSGTGNLGILLKNNLPAILTLLDKEGQPYQITLLSINNQLATVAFAHGEESVLLRDIESHWQGEFKIAWPMTPQGFSIIRPDETGAMVRWLTQSLLAAGINTSPVNTVYDATVFEAVKQFQRQRGLLADGVCGRQTISQLNLLNDSTLPRLVRISPQEDS